ncbi:YecR family lipoprotein [Porticoccus sp.]
MTRIKGSLVIAVFLICSATLSGCTTTKNWTATGGSRSDATVTLSYELGELEKAKLSESEARSMASRRCQSWGYSGADAFGGITRSCIQFGGFSGCRTWLVSKEFQCSGDGEEINRSEIAISAPKREENNLSGDDLYSAEQIARSQDCVVSKKLKDEGSIEAYQAACSGGSTLIIRCEWSNCESF